MPIEYRTSDWVGKVKLVMQAFARAATSFSSAHNENCQVRSVNEDEPGDEEQEDEGTRSVGQKSAVSLTA